MRAIVTSVCVLIASAASVASAQNARDYWILGTLPGPAGTIEAVAIVDANLITIEGSFRRAWVETYYQPHRQDGLARQASLIEFDCAGRRSRELQIAEYYRSTEARTISGNREWLYAIPQSGGEASLIFTCSSDEERRVIPGVIQLGWLPPERAAELLFSTAP